MAAYNVLKGIPRDGKIFGVTFFKKTDSRLRVMACRLGVKIKGTEFAGFNPMAGGILRVFDMHKGEYRTVNLNALMSVRSKGRLYLDTDFINRLSPYRRTW